LLIIIDVLLSKMNIKKILVLVTLFFSVGFLTPKTSNAVNLQEILTSGNSTMVKIQEGIEYFFAFRTAKKVEVLEKQAEKRLNMAQKYVDQKDNEKIQNMFQNYLQIKGKQNDLLEKTDEKDILRDVEESTIEQQKTMEEIKKKLNEDGKQNVVDIQEKVVNQVSQRIIEVDGPEGQTEFLNKVLHVWAPGTGPGGKAGVVYEGGTGIQFAPGTGPGGQGGVVINGGEMKFAPGTSGAEIKTVGDHPNTEEPVNAGGGNLAPGTIQGGGGGNTIDPGSVDQGTTSDSETWIDP
jgi:hypothetical protein